MMKSFKVLYIHHNGVFGGASKSLFEMIEALPENAVEPYLVAPYGTINKYCQHLKIPTINMLGCSVFDNTRLSYYRGMRWLILLRELLFIPFNTMAIFKAYYKWKDIDIIHVNEYMPILSIYLAKKLFKKPVVVHARSVQENSKTPKIIKFYKAFMEKYVDQVIAIDKDVFNSLPSKKNVSIIHNGLIVKNLETKKVKNKKFRVAIIGNLLKYKGVFEFIEAAKILQDKNYDIDFYFVGANIRKDTLKNKILYFLGITEDIYTKVNNYIEKNNLQNIHFTGFVDDITTFLPTIDINCFPSHLEAVGRSVFETAFYEVPSIVAITNPNDDTIINNVTGVVIKPYSPVELANAIKLLYDNPSFLKKLGRNAKKLAFENFDVYKNAIKILQLYKLLDKEYTK